MRLVTQMVRMRQEDAERELQKQREREDRRQKEIEKAKISPYTMFMTTEFGAWDQDGIPRRIRPVMMLRRVA